MTLKDQDCFYCNDREPLFSLMTEICELKCSRVFLFKDQKNPGRCVVQFKDHKTELFELTNEERQDFINDVSLVAKTINEMYGANKINYAIYGDLVPHLHVHLVPKTIDGVSWGKPFTDELPKQELGENELKAEVEKLRNALLTDRL
jgi:ATP adenylyltransferase